MSARTDVLLALSGSAEPLCVSEILDVLGLTKRERGGVDTALNTLFNEGVVIRIDDVRPYRYTLAPGAASAAKPEQAIDSAPSTETPASASAETVHDAEQAPASEPPPKRRGGNPEKPKAKPAKSALWLAGGENTAKALRDKLKLPVVATGNPEHKVPTLAPDASKLDNCRRLSTQLRVLSRTLEEWPEADVPAEIVSMIERCTREAA